MPYDDTKRSPIPDIVTQFRTLVETMPGGLAIDDVHGRIVYANSSLCRMLDYVQEEVTGRSILDILSGWSEDTIHSKIRDRRKGKTEYYQAELIHKSGKLIPVMVAAAPLFDSHGNLNGTFAVFTDQTESISAEVAAERSLMMYTQLFHQSGDAIIIHRPEGRVLDVNHAAMELFGYTRSQFLQLNIAHLVHQETDNSVKESPVGPRHALRGTADASLVKRSGAVFPADVISSTVETDEGRVVQMIVRDLTHEKRASDMLRAMSGRALLYLDLLSHDISNQLQIARVTKDLLSLRRNDEMEIRLLKDLGDSLDKMERIVSKTKATGQLMASVLEPRDLIKTVRNSVERFLISKDDLEVEMSIDTAEASVLADPLLDSLVTNIIENAYEHNPKDDKRIWIELISVDRGFELRIADNGPGIPHDVRTGLVDPSRRQGGVGLHMSRHIVEKYGGTLTIEDRVAKRPQGGTLVRIWLPVTSPGAPEEAS